jgi:hypothetical protein
MPKYKILVAQFPGGNSTHPDVADYVAGLMFQLRTHPDFGPGNVGMFKIADTPITMGRNRVMKLAEDQGYDYVLMIDSDMSPDLPYPDAVPFFDAAWEFTKKHNGPCVVAAPYCGPPPGEDVYVFHWHCSESDSANPNFQIGNVNRYEAAGLRGIQRVAALPTGLMLIPVEAVKRLAHPYFYYEWTDERQTHKLSTEDVTFARDLDVVGVPQYCAWSSWAGHHKSKLVGRPERIPGGSVPLFLRERAEELAREKLAGDLTEHEDKTGQTAEAKKVESRLKVPASLAEHKAVKNG